MQEKKYIQKKASQHRTPSTSTKEKNPCFTIQPIFIINGCGNNRTLLCTVQPGSFVLKRKKNMGQRSLSNANLSYRFIAPPSVQCGKLRCLNSYAFGNMFDGNLTSMAVQMCANQVTNRRLFTLGSNTYILFILLINLQHNPEVNTVKPNWQNYTTMQKLPFVLTNKWSGSQITLTIV